VTPDLLTAGAVWLEGQRHLHLSHDVTYVRGAGSVTLAATIGRSVFEQVDSSGVLQRVEARDFLVRAQDLVIASAEITPARGDKIQETIDGVVYTYEVLPFGGEPLWRWSDEAKITRRIHTKLISQA